MACINYKLHLAKYCVFLSDGITEYNKSILNYLKFLLQLKVGEILLQSIDNDGTGKKVHFIEGYQITKLTRWQLQIY